MEKAYYESYMLSSMTELFERTRLIVNESEDVDYLLLFKSKLEDTINESLKGVCSDMTKKINNLQRTKDFNIDLVQTLPTDVINLIKDFMIDDIEYVRRAYVIYDTQPYYRFIGSSRNIIEDMVKKLTVRKLILLIDNCCRRFIAKNKKREKYVDLIDSNFEEFFEDFNPLVSLIVNKNKTKYSIVGKYSCYTLCRMITILSR